MKKLCAAWFLSGAALAAPLPIATLDRPEPVDFAREIYPILKQNCLACHNTTKAKANLNLESSELMQKGGDNGPALKPGHGAESLLLKSAAHQDEDLIMPPPTNKVNAAALSPQQLALLQLWIDQGAKGGVVKESVGPAAWRQLAALEPVQAVAVSPDARLAAAARGNEVELCELPTGLILGQLADPDLAKSPPWQGAAVADRDAVMAVAFGADDLLATGGFRTIRLWRRQPRALMRAYGQLSAKPTALATTPDGAWAAAGDATGAIWLWRLDAEKFEPLALRDQSAPISALLSSPDGRLLLSAAEDRSCRVWDLAERTAVWRGDAPAVLRVLATLPGGRGLLAGGADGVVRVWPWLDQPPPAFPAPLREFKLQDAPLACLAAGAPGNFLWLGADGALHLCQAADGKELRKMAIEPPAARAVERRERELQVAKGLAATRKAQVAAAEARGKKEAESARAAAQLLAKARTESRAKREPLDAAREAQRTHPGEPAAVELVKKTEAEWQKADAAERAAKVNAELGVRLASEAAAALAAALAAQAEAEATLPEAQAALDAAKKLAAAPLPVPRQLFTLADGSTALLGTEDGATRLLGVADGALLALPEESGLVAPTAQNSLLAVDPTGQVRLLALRRAWTLERTIGRPEDSATLQDRVTALAFSPDGETLASGGGTPSREGEIKLWRVADGALLRLFPKAHADTVNSVVFSPDGETLASAASDRSARLWKVADGARLATLEGHAGQVLSAAWRADGLSLATAGADRSVRLWDPITRRPTKTTATFGGEVAAVAYLGAGDLLLTASGDKALRVGDQPLPDSPAFPYCAAADLSGRFILAGGEDGIVRMWSASDRKLLRTFPAGKP